MMTAVLRGVVDKYNLAGETLGDVSSGAVADRERIWHELQRELAAHMPNGRLRVVPRSGHHIQLDQAQAVTAAIRALVDAHRQPR